MPPSGFDLTEVKGLASSAHSLLTRFQGEVKQGMHASTEAGITHEITVIYRELARGIPHAERGVLMLVRELYLELQSGGTVEQIAHEIEALSNKTYG